MNGSVVISPSVRRERRVELVAQFDAIVRSWRKQRNDLEQIGIQIERFSLHHDIETRLLFGIGEQAIDEILQHAEIGALLEFAIPNPFLRDHIETGEGSDQPTGIRERCHSPCPQELHALLAQFERCVDHAVG